MENRIKYGFWTTLFMAYLFVSSLFMSCEKEEINPDLEKDPELTLATAETSPCGDPVTVELIAGKLMLSGTLTISNDASNMYVTYSSDSDWEINEVHLYVGDPMDVPLNPAGTPVPGLFPYSQSFSPAVSSYTFEIPLSELVVDCPAIFAHASVSGPSGTETAWSNNVGTSFVAGDASTGWTNGTSFNDLTGTKRWGGYTEYCIQTCEDEEEPDCYNEETAWSYGTSFGDITGTNRWGWVSLYEAGTEQSYMIYAGQTIPVGAVEVSQDASNLVLEINFNESAYFEKIHLYAGNEAGFMSVTNASGTPIPGHFPYSYDCAGCTSYTLYVPNSALEYDDIIWIALHFESFVAC